MGDCSPYAIARYMNEPSPREAEHLLDALAVDGLARVVERVESVQDEWPPWNRWEITPRGSAWLATPAPIRGSAPDSPGSRSPERALLPGGFHPPGSPGEGEREDALSHAPDSDLDPEESSDAYWAERNAIEQLAERCCDMILGHEAFEYSLDDDRERWRGLAESLRTSPPAHPIWYSAPDSPESRSGSGTLRERVFALAPPQGDPGMESPGRSAHSGILSWGGSGGGVPGRMLNDAARALGWRTDFACGGSPITWEMVLDEIGKLRKAR